METRRYRFIYNLNELRSNWSKQKPLETNKANLTVYFQDIELHLIEHISKATLVVGCVAWLTNSRVLRALAQVPKGVSILVQKEDFLRPDANVNGDWMRIPVKTITFSGRCRSHEPEQSDQFQGDNAG